MLGATAPALVAGFMLLPGGAFAQEQGSPSAPAAANSAAATKRDGAGATAPNDVPISYRIQTSDQLSIDVLAHPELHREVQVLTDGTITYPYLGSPNIKGKTLLEVTNMVTAALKKQIGNPRVLITVAKRDIKEVNILGTGIKGGGKRTLGDDWHILNLIADAGGLTMSDRPEFFTGRLVRGVNVISIDIARVVTGDPEQNILLEPGDTLFVDELDTVKTSVTVNGAGVGKPGVYPVPRDGSILTVLVTDAGGPKPTASLAKDTIKKADGTNKDIDLRSIQTTGQVSSDIKLEPGDVLTIPDNQLTVKVLGAVGKQGDLPYPDDKKVTVLDALSSAGGVREDADLKKAILAHPMPDGQVTSRVVDLEKLLKTGGATTTSGASSNTSKVTADSINPEMLPGDVLAVPSKKPKSSFNFLQVLAVLPYIGWIRSF